MQPLRSKLRTATRMNTDAWRTACIRPDGSGGATGSTPLSPRSGTMITFKEETTQNRGALIPLRTVKIGKAQQEGRPPEPTGNNVTATCRRDQPNQSAAATFLQDWSLPDIRHRQQQSRPILVPGALPEGFNEKADGSPPPDRNHVARSASKHRLGTATEVPVEGEQTLQMDYSPVVAKLASEIDLM